ncbi:A/G-specific adenine glycosylase [Sandaracinobacteroides sp. A072]|uniref:A/G-specific adenine glycosylase n=1 Tax=Sandaracinobacteroides sp. A072 TaxID=3461146 RepID=UPI0040422FC8
MPVDSISRPLLDWYDHSARALPWRSPPGSAPPDPYHVWLSEIMLQQTTVAAAAPYFQRFLDRWPSIEALAAADDEEVMRAWAGLGYYARARNLLAAARIVAARGGFPQTESALRALPGIGAYTAAAIAAIAFGEPATVIDANIERVASRLFAIHTPLPAARTAIAEALSAHVPAERPGDFAQAMMDLGASICTPRAPRCLACPLRKACTAHACGTPEAFPVKPPKKPRPLKLGTAWWIEHDGSIALVRRPPRGLLGGMPALPGTGWAETEDDSLPFGGQWHRLDTRVRHVFTHFELRLTLATTSVAERLPELAGQQLRWVPRSRILDEGLPTLYARAVRLVLESPQPQMKPEMP